MTDVGSATTPAAADVTVVIATHTELRWTSILSAVESVQKQDLPPTAIVIAVDHNPALADRLRAALPEVTVVPNDGRARGSSATRNAGVTAVRTAIVAFLDDDEIAEPDWLEALVYPFADPAVIGTGGHYQPVWLNGKPTWFPDQFAWVVGGCFDGMPQVAAKVRNVWSGNMAVRTDLFNQVGGFRADFAKVGNRSQPEDTDLCLRLSALVADGYWLYLPHAVIHHEVPATRSTLGFFLRRCFAEGRAKVDMARRLGFAGSLRDERAFVLRALVTGLRGHTADAGSAITRAAAILVGLTAAGLGVLVGVLLRDKPGTPCAPAEADAATAADVPLAAAVVPDSYSDGEPS